MINIGKSKSLGILTSTIRVIILIAICFIIGKSSEFANVITMLPFARGLTSFIRGTSKLVSSAITPKYASLNIPYVIYSDIAKTLLDGILSWVFRWGFFQLLFSALWPTDDPSDARDFYENRRGLNTSIRYFITGLIATFFSGKVFAFLFEGETALQLFGIKVFEVIDPLLPGISLTDVANAKSGLYTIQLIILAALYMLLLVAIALIRSVIDKHSGKEFVLFTFGGRSFGRVGFVGFSIYIFLKDTITTIINSFIILMIYMCFSTPSAASISGTIMLMLFGIGVMLFCN